MDSILTRQVADALNRALAGARLDAMREEPGPRVRLVFDDGSRRAALVIGLAPERPWIGRPGPFRDETRVAPGAFVGPAAAALRGAVLEQVRQVGFDRAVELRFRDGRALYAELAVHRANLVLVDGRGCVSASLRLPKGARDRLRPGADYAPPPLPRGRHVPDLADPRPGLAAALREAREAGLGPREGLLRKVLGPGPDTADLVLAESLRRGRAAEDVLADRLAALPGGADGPVIEAPEAPERAAESGTWDPSRFRLLPWAPAGKPEEATLFRGDDAAATVGLYHAAADRVADVERRLGALLSIVERERRRTAGSRDRVRRDLEAFEDPERFRIWGEALLAGLAVARRVGESVVVPDPYDAAGGELRVPAAPGLALTRVADGHFRRHRRALRGLEAARRRAAELDDRERRLARLAADWSGRRGLEAARGLQAEMRAAGIPVGLEPETRRSRARAVTTRPRLEGVRMYASADGLTILAGKTARDNDRLTFKLAAPEDFWCHARGCPGAHVVIRNPERLARPPRRTLLEAAALAAYYSDLRGEGGVEVDWTRRKHVRKARGAPPGTVLLKRFETLRVRPALPSGTAERGAAGDRR